MQDLFAAFGLFLVIEGLVYALFPGAIRAIASQLPGITDQTLRNFGVIAMFFGVAIVWWIRG